jgi:hypothetical protein
MIPRRIKPDNRTKWSKGRARAHLSSLAHLHADAKAGSGGHLGERVESEGVDSAAHELRDARPSNAEEPCSFGLRPLFALDVAFQARSSEETAASGSRRPRDHLQWRPIRYRRFLLSSAYLPQSVKPREERKRFSAACDATRATDRTAAGGRATLPARFRMRLRGAEPWLL